MSIKHKIMAVYDEKAQAYLPPFFLPNVAMGERVFSDCVNSSDHQFSKHPYDYTLFSLGEFDVETGEFDIAVAKKLQNGVECKKPPPPEI